MGLEQDDTWALDKRESPNFRYTQGIKEPVRSQRRC